MEIKTMNKIQKALPRIVFLENAYYNMIKLYTAKITETKEFMFIGTVSKVDNKGVKVYTIQDIKLIPQESNSGAYCETDDDRYPAWLHENFPTVQDKMKVRLNGHSHVNMAVNPSGTDDNNIEKMMQYVDDYFIQLIINRRQEIKINLWDKEAGLIFNNCSYFIEVGDTLIKVNDSSTGTGSIVSLPELNANDFTTTTDKFIFKNNNVYIDVLRNQTFIISDKLIYRPNKPIEAIVSENEKKEIEKSFTELLKTPKFQSPHQQSFPYYDDVYSEDARDYSYYYNKWAKYDEKPKKKGGKK